MNNTYYLAQIVEEPCDIFAKSEFVGIFTTRKNAEDVVCDILSKKYNKAIHYTDYSAEADFLDEHFNEYTVDKIEVNKNYY